MTTTNDTTQAPLQVDDTLASIWYGYGGGNADALHGGYRAWASIHHAEHLAQVVFYAGGVDVLLTNEEPLLFSTALELSRHPDRRVRLLGWTLFVDLVLRVPGAAQSAIQGLRDELKEAITEGTMDD